MNITIKPVKNTIRTGQVYKHGNSLYLLAQVDCKKLALVSLSDLANRFNEPVYCGEVRDVPADVFEKCCGSSVGEFHLVGTL